MNNIAIFQDKVNFVVWRTKSGHHIPIFGGGEKRWTSRQKTLYNKKKITKLERQKNDLDFRLKKLISEFGIATSDEKKKIMEKITPLKEKHTSVVRKIGELRKRNKIEDESVTKKTTISRELKQMRNVDDLTFEKQMIYAKYGDTSISLFGDSKRDILVAKGYLDDLSDNIISRSGSAHKNVVNVGLISKFTGKLEKYDKGCDGLHLSGRKMSITRKSANQRRDLYHELGHSMKIPESFKDIKSKAQTKYGRTSIDEDWAESVKLFCVESLSDKGRYNILSNYFGD